jgi:hypothetical protein
MTQPKMVMLSVRVPLDLRSAVHKQAEAEQRTFQVTVARLLKSGIELSQRGTVAHEQSQ